jgi:hypothetical protein
VYLYVPVVDDPRYIVGGGADTSVRLGAFLELLLIIANIGTAIVLFPILKRQNEILALGYVTARVIECVFIAVGILSLLTVVTLRQEAAAGADTASLVAVVEALEAVLETPAGRQLEELRCGPHQHEEVRYWQANLLFERVSEQAGHPVHPV